MATVRYGDVVQANDEVVSLEEKLKRRRASAEGSQPQDPNGSTEQTETQNSNEPKKRSV